jgi:ABC-type glycerol-3-phosphate transport system substrate-binding protein
VPRAPLVLLTLIAALATVGCGGGDTKTVTETKTVTVTNTTPAPTDQDAILDAATAFYAAGTGSGIPRSDLKVVKTNGTFADVQVGTDAHVILKKGGNTWVVLWDGNGTSPPETRQRFAIPADYGG